MSLEMKDDEGFPLFLIDVSRHGESSVSFNVKEVEGWYEDGTPTKSAPYCTCWIKWDGCSTFHFEEGLHLCGPFFYKRHQNLMHFLYEQAMEYLGQESQWS